jgi:predicted dehydrogenase
MITEQIGRRLRLALIGGGPGSAIGETHRIAARLDGHYEIVAAALSSNPQRSRESAVALGIPQERAYDAWQTLIESEAMREDGADVIAVMTPNDSHHEICSAALEAGFHIICDKPLTNDLATSVDLARNVKRAGAEFCLTYCYTGYPMVRQARDMVRNGVIGTIRQIHLQYVQGWFLSDDRAPAWRSDPGRVGRSAIVIDIGTHAYHLGSFVSGLDAASLCADVGHVVPERRVDDYGSLLLRYANGARGSMWVTNAAAGAEHGLSFRIFGEFGGLEWHQEVPNQLIHRSRDGFAKIITRRKDQLVTQNARRATRIAIGHPEGYLEAFANLYCDLADTVAGRLQGKAANELERHFPTVEDGVKGLAFVEAAMRSARSGHWETLESPST